MNKVGITIFVVLIFFNILLGIFLINPSGRIDPLVKDFNDRIDSLQSEINILEAFRDSVQIRVDTVYKEIRINTIKYEKTRDSIINYSASDDYDFFTSYLNWYRLNNSSNSSEFKGN